LQGEPCAFQKTSESNSKLLIRAPEVNERKRMAEG
jgi:hypothetical protein